MYTHANAPASLHPTNVLPRVFSDGGADSNHNTGCPTSDENCTYDASIHETFIKTNDLLRSFIHLVFSSSSRLCLRTLIFLIPIVPTYHVNNSSKRRRVFCVGWMLPSALKLVWLIGCKMCTLVWNDWMPQWCLHWTIISLFCIDPSCWHALLWFSVYRSQSGCLTIPSAISIAKTRVQVLLSASLLHIAYSFINSIINTTCSISLFLMWRDCCFMSSSCAFVDAHGGVSFIEGSFSKDLHELNGYRSYENND